MDLCELVRAALEEDIGSGDLTTEFTVDSERMGHAQVIAKSDGVLSGSEPFREVFRQLDDSLSVKFLITDGEPLKAGDCVAELRGHVVPILTGERTALNFLQRLSGIATLTKRYSDALVGTRVKILDTRKTTPLLRDLEKAAVRHSGGVNHRRGLYDMILIKENHEMAAGGIVQAILKVEAGIEKSKFRVPVEVEVQNLEQVNEIIGYIQSSQKLRINRILLDNFDLAGIETALKTVAGKIPLEVSGGINLQNVHKIAQTGVDYISIGALTHSAPALDFSLLLIE